ncbi:hypothetical protein V7O66_05795 [Methanolobus sp. ZRKC3]|uniref:hypothetical protein n=1 Tax=Methanolobus sp. ZRKC3 TaxID=3125786 RepID=UPI003245F519
MSSKQEDFWDRKNFVVVSDGTKPAMKWTINELRKRGKNLLVVDLSDKPDEESINDISDIPNKAENVVIGVTKSEPAEIIQKLKSKGITSYWVHMGTDTCDVEHLTYDPELDIITKRCPMMYLGKDASIHGIHRFVSRILGKY